MVPWCASCARTRVDCWVWVCITSPCICCVCRVRAIACQWWLECPHTRTAPLILRATLPPSAPHPHTHTTTTTSTAVFPLITHCHHRQAYHSHVATVTAHVLGLLLPAAICVCGAASCASFLPLAMPLLPCAGGCCAAGSSLLRAPALSRPCLSVTGSQQQLKRSAERMQRVTLQPQGVVENTCASLVQQSGHPAVRTQPPRRRHTDGDHRPRRLRWPTCDALRLWLLDQRAGLLCAQPVP
jgi:hypothetical protein